MPQHVYHWKHGWIPLDHAAALQKAKGNHVTAARYMADASSAESGIHKREDVAKALIRTTEISDPTDRARARQEVSAAAERLNAIDSIPSTLQTRSEQLSAAAAAKRAAGQHIFESAGVPDTAAGRLSAPGLAQAHRNTDSQLQRFTQAQAEARALEHKAGLARARESEAARTRYAAADLKGARFVKDRYGWHEVVRVNAKTVTVKTPYSWTDSIPIGKIHDHRK
jgi:hypothetical protein